MSFVLVFCRGALNVSIFPAEIPTKPDEWRKIAEGFEENWNFSHCLDGKHKMIESPINSGSEYFFNYKGFFSVGLIVLEDANYCFTLIDCGCQGRHTE
ncbi:hypothetical protein JTB14_020123 [Gonioctena quinquepunctata]|nr:hypothetical protein JTB14_020123 [Gonioctena quinquepunctata]